MRNTSYIILALVLFVLVSGTVFLAIWEIPSPRVPTEKVINDDRFRK